ncbi:MAG: RtcB family protein [Bacteroidota bacterium]
MAHKLRSKDFKKIDIHSNQTISLLISILKKHFKHNTIHEQLELIQKIKKEPENYLQDPILNRIANEFYQPESVNTTLIDVKDHDIEFNIFGRPLIKSNAYQQMKMALKLPISRKAALMPDSHLGYGIPVGGVLATEKAVIPYAVGMDIGCRMSLTLYHATERFFNMHSHKFKQSIVDNTAFGISKVIGYAQEHEFLDRDVFRATPLLKSLKKKAARQLGSSGSGNHFVEWGLVDLKHDETTELPAGTYVGLLAHSGSRGFGASIARFYSDLAKNNSNLPFNLRHLAWLDLDKDEGKEYWEAMNLAGDYARACHDRIHINVAKAVGLDPIGKIENHHNFAWKELIDAQEIIVHRKGATPAGKDQLGIIPGSMTDPGFIVKGRGNRQSINSASHGAGRKCSRKEIQSKTTNSAMKKHLRQHRVTLIGGALDESPFAYKSLEQVMAHQQELVEKIGTFTPRIVRMDRG